jgi:hypothetical protein
MYPHLECIRTLKEVGTVYEVINQLINQSTNQCAETERRLKTRRCPETEWCAETTGVQHRGGPFAPFQI